MALAAEAEFEQDVLADSERGGLDPPDEYESCQLEAQEFPGRKPEGGQVAGGEDHVEDAAEEPGDGDVEKCLGAPGDDGGRDLGGMWTEEAGVVAPWRWSWVQRHTGMGPFADFYSTCQPRYAGGWAVRVGVGTGAYSATRLLTLGEIRDSKHPYGFRAGSFPDATPARGGSSEEQHAAVHGG